MILDDIVSGGSFLDYSAVSVFELGWNVEIPHLKFKLRRAEREREKSTRSVHQNLLRPQLITFRYFSVLHTVPISVDLPLNCKASEETATHWWHCQLTADGKPGFVLFLIVATRKL